MDKIPIDQYITIPYKDGGRDRSGIDCFGLVILVEREVFGIELDDLLYRSSEDFDSNSHLVDAHRATIEAELVNDPEEGDLVLVRYNGLACHVGVYVEPRCVLHSVSGLGTVCEKLDSPRIRHRVEGFYRVSK